MGWFDKLFGPPEPVKPDVVEGNGPTQARVIVHVTWASPEDIDAVMPGKLAFCKGPEKMSDGEWHAWITAPLPAGFNDHSRMETLGHEFFHALGARHA